MSLYTMTTRRIKALISWVLAAAIVVLIAAGFYYVVQVL